jgi:hypothetical protein
LEACAANASCKACVLGDASCNFDEIQTNAAFAAINGCQGGPCAGSCQPQRLCGDIPCSEGCPTRCSPNGVDGSQVRRRRGTGGSVGRFADLGDELPGLTVAFAAMPNEHPKDFIRSMPTASAEEVVAAAKKKGLSTTPAYVEKLRIIDRARAANPRGAKAGASKQTSPAKASKAPAKSASAPPASAPPAMPPMAAKLTKRRATGKVGRPPKVASPSAVPSKSDFIRSMPRSSASDIVAAAKAKGLLFSEKYVSTIRSNERKAKTGPAKRGPGRPARAASPSPSTRPTSIRAGASKTTGGDVEERFRAAAIALALDRGLGTARTTLEEVVSKLRAAGG